MLSISCTPNTLPQMFNADDFFKIFSLSLTEAPPEQWQKCTLTNSLQVVSDRPTVTNISYMSHFKSKSVFLRKTRITEPFSPKGFFSKASILRSLVGESAQLCAFMRLERSERVKSGRQKKTRCCFLLCTGRSSRRRSSHDLHLRLRRNRVIWRCLMLFVISTT